MSSDTSRLRANQWRLEPVASIIALVSYGFFCEVVNGE
jgi:hypothetical protein